MKKKFLKIFFFDFSKKNFLGPKKNSARKKIGPKIFSDPSPTHIQVSGDSKKIPTHTLARAGSLLVIIHMCENVSLSVSQSHLGISLYSDYFLGEYFISVYVWSIFRKNISPWSRSLRLASCRLLPVSEATSCYWKFASLAGKPVLFLKVYVCMYDVCMYSS